mgnify:CR=1 FL=1
MARIDILKKKIESYLKKEQLLKSTEYTKLEKPYLAKARKNFTAANLLFRISDQEKLKDILNLAFDFYFYDWVIIISYYAMYISALAALVKLGFKSKSHAATIAVLEYYYAHQPKDLGVKYLQQLTKAYIISEELINKLTQTKMRRENAQYDATHAISRENAVVALNDAEEFVSKIEEILEVSK